MIGKADAAPARRCFRWPVTGIEFMRQAGSAPPSLRRRLRCARRARLGGAVAYGAIARPTTWPRPGYPGHPTLSASRRSSAPTPAVPAARARRGSTARRLASRHPPPRQPRHDLHVGVLAHGGELASQGVATIAIHHVATVAAAWYRNACSGRRPASSWTPVAAASIWTATAHRRQRRLAPAAPRRRSATATRCARPRSTAPAGAPDRSRHRRRRRRRDRPRSVNASRRGPIAGRDHATMLLARTPRVAGVITSPEARPSRPSPESSRFGWARDASRVPSLINIGGQLRVRRGLPLRDLPPLTNTVPGAMALARMLDRYEWLWQAANPVA